MDKVTCQFCGHEARTLTQHLRRTHPEVDIAEYRRQYPVVSDSAKSKYAASAKKTKNRAGTETAQQARDNMRSGALGKVISLETRLKMSETHKQRQQDPELRRRTSLGVANAIRNGRRNHNQYQTGYVQIGFGSFYHRSSYEKKFLEMIGRDPEVIGLQYEAITIPYGSFQHYVPDYWVRLIDGRRFLVEVKPKRLLGYCKEKFEAATAWCSQNGASFLVVTEATLRESSTTTSLWGTAEATAAPSRLPGRRVKR